MKKNGIGILATVIATLSASVWAVRSYTRKSNVKQDDHLEQESNYTEELLEKFGTTQGVIDVADKKAFKRNKKESLKKLKRISKPIEAIYDQGKQKKLSFGDSLKEWKSHLEGKTRTIQVTLTNVSNIEREVNLWGSTLGKPLSPALESDVGKLSLVASNTTGNFPSELAFHPITGNIYVVNQFSDSISIKDVDNNDVEEVKLGGDADFGLDSLASIAINDNPQSNEYGYVYVVGAISDILYTLDLNNELVSKVNISSRPLSVRYNKVLDRIAICCSYESRFVSIDLKNNRNLTETTVKQNPVDICINPENGHSYVIANRGKYIDELDASNNIIASVAINGSPVKCAYNHHKKVVAVLTHNRDSIGVYDPKTQEYTLGVRLPAESNSFQYNHENGFYYAVEYFGRRLFRVNEENYNITSLNPFPADILYIGGRDNGFWAISSFSATITKFILIETIEAIKVSSNYNAINNSTVNEPLLLKHAKFISQDQTGFGRLKVITQSSTGTKKQFELNSQSYLSPSNFQFVAELKELNNTKLSGDTFWNFKIPRSKSLTILLYVQEYRLDQLLPIYNPNILKKTNNE